MSFLDPPAEPTRLETAGVPTGAFGRWLGLLPLLLGVVPRLPAAARTLDAYAVLDGRRIVRLEGSRPPVPRTGA